MSNAVVRYSDSDLAEFKTIIDVKLERARVQLQSLQEQILEIAENASDDHGGDWMDDSNTNNDVEMLNNMSIRQRRYIQELENALIRIRNKAYGICSVTGELIDKKRLLAVPTTTKSLAAKTQPPSSQRPVISRPAPVSNDDDDDEDDDDEDEKPAKPPKPVKNKVITRVIRKTAGPKPPAKAIDLDEEEDDYDPYDDDDIDSMGGKIISLDELSGDDDDQLEDEGLSLNDGGEEEEEDI